MRLKLPLPESWPSEELGPFHVRAELPGGALLEASLSVGAPVEVEAWARDAMLARVPADGQAGFVPPAQLLPPLTERETRAGWPFQLLAAEVAVDGPDGGPEPDAIHVGAFFVFLAYAAEVHVSCPSRAALAALAEPLRRLLLGATVEWPDDSAATLAGLCT